MNEIIVQAGYMTGDMFGVAAALRLKYDLRILVVYDDKDQKMSRDMIAMYRTSVGLNHPARVKELKVADSRNFYKSLHEPRTDSGTNKSTVYAQFPDIGRSSPPIKPMGYSTATVKTEFNKGNDFARQQIVKQWEIDEFDELGLARFLSRMGIVTNGKYLFLWIRRSGEMGGAHAELDASHLGWQQIIDRLPLGTTPVIIGDQFNDPLAHSNSRIIPQEPARPLTFQTLKPLNLTRFWEQPPFCLYKHSKFLGAEARRSQLALFDYMLRAGYKVCHLGMRSGVLESVALMGSPVVYMEEKGNPQQSRIENLANSMNNFSRLELGELPTVTGKVIDRNQKTEWSSLHGPKLKALKDHCNEDFKVIAARITEVEKAIKPGSPLANYQKAFIDLAIPVWKAKFPSVTNWGMYRSKNLHWCMKLETLLKQLYDATWNTTGVTEGFNSTDLAKILSAINTRLS